MVFDLMSPYYPDFDLGVNGRPFVNHYNEFAVSNVAVGMVGEESGLWQLGVVVEGVVSR